MTTSVYEPEHRFRRAVLGIIALALFGSAVWLTWYFLRGGLQSGATVDAVFSGPGIGEQLPVNGDVKIRGVLVGSIADLHLDDDGSAIVQMRLHEEIEIPASSRAEIRSKTVFGQKWVELIPPEVTAGPMLADGSVIPDDQTTEPLELERALQLGHDLLKEVPYRDLGAVLGALADGFAGSEPDARRAIDRGLVALRAVNQRSGDLDLALRQLNEFSAWLDDNDDTLLSFMATDDDFNRALVAAGPELRRNLAVVPEFLNAFTDFQERTEKNLGRLIEQGATLAELLAVRSDDLTDLIVQLQPFTTIWNSGLSQPCAGEFESDLTCWQLYLLPGLDSRGFYGPGEGPDRNDPGDPNYGQGPAVPTAAGSGDKIDLTRLLRAEAGGRS